VGAWIAAIFFSLSASWVMAAPAVEKDGYPSRALRFIVPFPAGATNDIYARIIGRHLAESMGQPVIVDNRPGASGLLATEMVANAQRDGYTIMIHSSSLTTAIAIQPKTSFDPFKDLTPVIELAVAPLLMTITAGSPIKTMPELLAYARAKPGALNYGSSGIGSILHLGTEVLNRMANINTVHVSFKGGAPAVVALAGGEIQMYLTPMLDVMPQIKAGKVRVIAVSSAKRSSYMPDLPTIAESGVPGYAVSQWFGLFSTGAVPAAAVQRLNQEVVAMSQARELLDRFADAGAERVMGTPAAFSKQYRDDVVFWRKVVREANIKAE
jgi:tripartite-type tricarboxylate transporter receptor subunit TctC